MQPCGANHAIVNLKMCNVRVASLHKLLTITELDCVSCANHLLSVVVENGPAMQIEVYCEQHIALYESLKMFRHFNEQIAHCLCKMMKVKRASLPSCLKK